MANLSNDYTAAKLWREAVREIPDVDNITTFDKFDILNRAQEIAQGLVADVVAESYMTDLTPVFDSASKVQSDYGGAGMTWTASTKTLVSPMTTNFASTDVGKLIVFSDASNNVYMGTIATYISTTSVTVTGDNLPSADIANVQGVFVANTTPSGDVVDISEARILRAGTQNRIKLLSTLTSNVEMVGDDELQKFRLIYYAAPHNKNKIVWNLVGVNIYLAKGSNLSNYGTLTFRYPRLPNKLSLDTDYMDVLDGSMMQLTICVTKNLIVKRLGEHQKYNNNEELASYIQAIYRQFGGEIEIADAAKKLEGLA